MATSNGKTGNFRGYRFYNWVRQDPICAKTQDLIEKEGFKGTGQPRRLSLLTGLAASTVSNLTGNKTRLPRHSTIGAIVAALGYKEVFVKNKEFSIDREKEIAKAAMEIKKKRQQATASGRPK